MTSNADERFAAWLRRASADYNAPPSGAAPREEMWRHIAAVRASHRASRVWHFASPRAWTLAAAATMLLAVGIGIGRLTGRDSVLTHVPPAGAADRGAPDTYDVAATRHLTNAEALVTAVRMSRYAAADTGIQRWARDLLTDTRLLLDSPAGSDASRRALLEDLELLIVQIVELEDSRTSDTKELLLDTAQQDQLLTRLRANVPAGRPSARS